MVDETEEDVALEVCSTQALRSTTSSVGRVADGATGSKTISSENAVCATDVVPAFARISVLRVKDMTNLHRLS